MVEELHIPKTDNREEVYRSLIPQLEALIGNEEDAIAIMSNVAAVLSKSFGFFWVGFYIVKNNELVLGPFQGDLACFRIQKGKGVCGTAWETGETVLVSDVSTFPGHIACSSESRSEIVVPIMINGEVVAVLDVDSKTLNDFDELDKKWLERIAELCAIYLDVQ